MKQKEIKVLVLEPMQVPKVTTIPNSLAELEQIVGGWIQVIAPFNDTAVIICNEDGKILDPALPLNRLIGNDIIAGTFIIAGANLDDGEFISLTEGQIEEYQRMFSYLVQRSVNSFTIN